MTTSKVAKPGDVVLVQFPFTDLENSKKRPALVLRETNYSRNMQLISIAMITSQIEMPEIEGDYLVKEWKTAGLLHPSRLRLSKVATLEGSLIVKKMGDLSETDFKGISRLFRKLYHVWLA